MTAQAIVRWDDGGGIWIDANGVVHHIPPFEPGLRLQLQALGLLMRAERHAPGSAELTAPLGHTVFKGVQEAIGGAELTELIGVAGDDGWRCGNNRDPRVIGPRSATSERVAANL